MNSLLSSVTGFSSIESGFISPASYQVFLRKTGYMTSGALQKNNTVLPSTEATELDKLRVFLRLVPNACFSRLCHSLQVSRHSYTLNVLQRLVLWYVFPRSGFATSFLVLCISYMFSLENDTFVHVYITLIYSYWVELQTTYLDHTFSFVHLAPKTNQREGKKGVRETSNQCVQERRLRH